MRNNSLTDQALSFPFFQTLFPLSLGNGGWENITSKTIEMTAHYYCGSHSINYNNNYYIPSSNLFFCGY